MERRFKLGETVLARRWDADIWEPILYSRYDENADWGYCHVGFGGVRYRLCIPLEGNERLVGTAMESPDEPLWNPMKSRQYKYLQEVEVNGTGEPNDWEPAHYISFDSTEGERSPHQVVMDESATVIWVEDAFIRPKRKDQS